MVFQEVTSSSFWFQVAWGLGTDGQHEVSFFYLEKILVSAMKQSLKPTLPILNGMTPFDKFISQPFGGQKFIAHCYEGDKEPLLQTLQPGEDALVLIGPEGDFSPEEVQKAIANGFRPITLGRSRLRTETAALVAVHMMNVKNAVF